MLTDNLRQGSRALARGITAVALLCMLGWSLAARADYPERPVRLVVPFAPGTSVDSVARLLADAVAASWGQPIVVENMPGAAGNIAVGRVAKAAPDGYTLAFSGDAALVVNVSLFEQLGYDPLRDLVPITQIAITPNILVVNNNVPAQSVADLVARARAEPGGLSIASAGYGTSQHLAIEMLKRSAGIELMHVPYKGSYLPDLMAGHVKAAFANVVAALPLVRAGKLRALAVSAERRLPAIPELPTMAEAGAAGVVASAWFGVVAPAGTPAAVVQRVHAEFTRALARPDLRQQLIASGVDIVGSSPEDFAALLRAEIPRMAKVIEAAGLDKIDFDAMYRLRGTRP